MSNLKAPNKLNPARLTVILENAMGIKKQTWIGTPKDFGMSWPIEANSLLGERTTMMVVAPTEIEFKATMTCPGNVYRADHSK